MVGSFALARCNTVMKVGVLGLAVTVGHRTNSGQSCNVSGQMCYLSGTNKLWATNCPVNLEALLRARPGVCLLTYVPTHNPLPKKRVK